MLEGGDRGVIAGRGYVGLPPAMFLTHGGPVVIDLTPPACARIGPGRLPRPAHRPNAGDTRESPATLVGVEARYVLDTRRRSSS
jgi:hypothetical protein